MSREACDDTEWCAYCRRDVTVSTVDTFVPHTAVPGTGMTEFCPGTNKTATRVEVEIAEAR